MLRASLRLRDTQEQMSPLTRRFLLSTSAVVLLGVVLVGGFAWGFQAHRARVFPYAYLKAVVTGQGPATAPDTPGRWRLRDGRRPWILEDPRAFTQKALEELGYAEGSVMAPEASGVVVNTERAQAGLNLVTSGDAATAQLMALDGTVVHEWRTSWQKVFPDQVGKAKPPRPYLRRARLLPDGHLLSLFVDKGAFRLDREGEVVWAWAGGAHHDLALQDDALWVLARDPQIRPEVDPHTPMIDDALVRLDPKTGELRQRFTLWQAVADSAYAPLLKKVRMRGDADPLHSNTVRILDGRFESVNPAFSRGNLLVSVRHTDWVLVIDPRLQRVVWAMSGPWHQPHEPTLVEPGHLLIFDNLGAWPRSRVLEIDPNSQQVIWAYDGGAAPLISETCGTAQRLANGNTLAVASDTGRAIEVTSGGEVVWAFINPARAGDKGELIATLFQVERLSGRELGPWAPAPDPSELSLPDETGL